MISRYQEFREKQIQKRKETVEKETDSFLGAIDNIIDSSNDVVFPHVSRLKETDKNYINFYIRSFPNCLEYGVTMYKKEHPFDIYYSKKYFKREIPKKIFKGI